MAHKRLQYIIHIEKEGLVGLQSRLAYMNIRLSPMEILDGGTHYWVLPALRMDDASTLVELGYTVTLDEETLTTCRGQRPSIDLDHQ